MEKLEISPIADMATKCGVFKIISFRKSPIHTNLAIWKGDLTNKEIASEIPPIVRIQSSCITSTALGAILCDCAEQMSTSFKMIANEGVGLFIYLSDEGRGHGLHEKICGMFEMNKGETTVSAYTKRGLKPDIRTYNDAVIILKHLNVFPTIRLITNNPAKILSLESNGFSVIERIPIEIEPTEWTKKYLLSKKNELGHIINCI